MNARKTGFLHYSGAERNTSQRKKIYTKEIVYIFHFENTGIEY